MGMFDWMTVEVPLPDGLDPTGLEFQTKDFDSALERLTLQADGRLRVHRVKYEPTPEEEMPYYGTPEWEEGGLWRFFGCMRPCEEWDEVLEHHGDIRFYTALPVEGENGKREFREYTARFTHGRLEWIKPVKRDR